MLALFLVSRSDAMPPGIRLPRLRVFFNPPCRVRLAILGIFLLFSYPPQSFTLTITVVTGCPSRTQLPISTVQRDIRLGLHQENLSSTAMSSRGKDIEVQSSITATVQHNMIT